MSQKLSVAELISVVPRPFRKLGRQQWRVFRAVFQKPYRQATHSSRCAGRIGIGGVHLLSVVVLIQRRCPAHHGPEKTARLPGS